MKNQKSQPLTSQIQSLKEIIKDLAQLENNDSAELVSQLLKIMVSLFEEVERRLLELENKKKLWLKNSKLKPLF